LRKLSKLNHYRNSVILTILLFFSVFQLPAQIRSLDTIFPGLAPETKNAVFSADGYMKSTKASSVNNLLIKHPNTLNPDITAKVLNSNSGFFVEAMLVLPGNKSLLQIYNAIGNIQDLRGRTYQSFTKGTEVPLFEEATRIESAKKNNPIPDPPPALSVPKTDTVYVRLKDVNFGNCYYRGDMIAEKNGLRFSLTNYKSLSYMLVPVIKEEKFIAQLYFENIQEGILVYGITGAEVSDFVASKIDMLSAIKKRMAVIIAWGSDGLK